MTYRNLILTMLLGGLWHGAAWNFIIWGALHGGWLAAERALFGAGYAGAGEGWRKTLGWALTFHVVCAAWVFFRAQDLATALSWFRGLADMTGDVTGLTWFTLILIVGVLAMQFSPRDGVMACGLRFAKLPLAAMMALFTIGLLFILWLSPAGTAPFIYFQF